MPVNPGIEYKLAEQEYLKAETLQQKIKCLEKMLSTVPKHKSSEGLQQQLKQKLSKLRTQQEKERKKKSSRYQISVKKEGAAQIVIIGVPNSGKSTLLSKLTNAKPTINPYPYSTKLPEVGIMDYEGIKLQVVEIPAILRGFENSDKGPLFLGIIRNADLVMFLLREDPEREFELLITELEKANIKVNREKKDNYNTYLNGTIIINSYKNFKVKNFECVNIHDKDLTIKIWNNLGLIYVFTKTHGKKRDWQQCGKNACL